MAATLTQLRARLILPTIAPEAQVAVREAEELRRQLLSRQHIQAAANWLERRQQLGLHVWSRGSTKERVGGVPTVGGDLAELMRAYLLALALPDQLSDVYRLPPRTLWPMQASVSRIRERLAELPHGSELTTFLPDLKAEDGFRAKSAVASTFLAGLELARDGQLTLDQDEAWRKIRIRASRR